MLHFVQLGQSESDLFEPPSQPPTQERVQKPKS